MLSNNRDAGFIWDMLQAIAKIHQFTENLSFEEAGCICDGMMLAHNLIRKIDFSKQPRILINGASGSIGTACLQMAKAKGVFVTAVCKTEYVERVRALGADEVIDYQKEDFTKRPHQFEVVIDAVGKSSFFKCLPILKPRGIYFSTELGYLTQNIWLALITPLFLGKKVLFPIPTDNQELITEFKDLIEAGKFTSVIDRVYPFAGMVEATRYVETGEKFGNVAVKVVD
jgi:NADPH:quinone reductase-like Zn-dependent oxidoreductase